MKALVYGLAKTGTTSAANILGEIYDKSWHSEEFLLHVWVPLADRYWTKEENGGSIWYFDRLATPSAPAYKGHSFWPRSDYGSDRIVQKGLDPAELAEALEKCNVDSMTFDGMESLFWLIYEQSPEAKVIFLNWREYQAWIRSCVDFEGDKAMALALLSFLNVGQHYLPWNAFLMPLLDHFEGTATDLLRKGNRMLDYNSLLILLFGQSVAERRFLQHHYSGLGLPVWSEKDYNQFWDYAKEIIPKERRIELNLKKHSPADLCRMLGVTDKPICQNTGKIPTTQPLMTMERKVWHLLLAACPWFIFLHWANHTLTWTVIYWIAGKLFSVVLGCAALLGCDTKSFSSLVKGKKKSKHKA